MADGARSKGTSTMNDLLGSMDILSIEVSAAQAV
jgi:hypothetical protein